MNDNITRHRNNDTAKPTSAWLLRNPIDFIAEDHLRLRAMCAEMDRLADCEAIPQADMQAIREYLTEELPALLADEDRDLMPMVLKRAEPEDELPRLARRLDREHREIDRLLAEVLTGIAGRSPDMALGDEVRQRLRDLAQATRRHLILENAVLLPLARVRLNAADLVILRDAMLRRRGLEGLFAA